VHFPEPPPLRPFQKRAIQLLEEGTHLVCISPTGSGKSRIYEEIALKLGPRTLLFAPLLALARQQERSLGERGIRTFGKFSEQARPRRRESGVWSLRPESLLHPQTRLRIEAWKPQFLVVDECHCCWDWGESFRPAFRQLLEVNARLKPERSLWLTATLPTPARELLESRIPQPLRFMGEFDLPEGLSFRALRIPLSERSDALASWLASKPRPGIVFVSTREMTERLTRLIRATGREALAYHAGLSREERAAIEDRLRREPGSGVVVATSAFGMGMHFPLLAWAVLWQAPASLLSLAQSIGRVGRGEGKAQALLFWDEDDFRLIEWMAQGSRTRGRELAQVRAFLFEEGCRVRALRKFFGAEPREGCCSSCEAFENFTRA
jgi:ATP-dependent DNA helicase RecQ